VDGERDQDTRSQRQPAKESKQSKQSDAKVIEELPAQTEVALTQIFKKSEKGNSMRKRSRQGLQVPLLALLTLAAGTVFARPSAAQNPEMHFRVVMGPDGKPQKTSLDPPPSDHSSGGRLKRHIVEKKKEEYKDYADQMKDLAQQYVPPDKDRLQQAYQQGNITLGPSGGAPNQIQLVIHNYMKSQDSMTLLFDKTQGGLVSLQIASYMDDPKDAMNLTVEFSRLSDGTNHVSNVVVNGVSKKMTVAIENSSYQHL
jgi:hypothetical protein